MGRECRALGATVASCQYYINGFSGCRDKYLMNNLRNEGITAAGSEQVKLGDRSMWQLVTRGTGKKQKTMKVDSQLSFTPSQGCPPSGVLPSQLNISRNTLNCVPRHRESMPPLNHLMDTG